MNGSLNLLLVTDFNMLETLVAAAIPAVIDLLKSGGKAISRRFIGLSVEDQIKLMQADTGRLEALAQLDNPHGLQPSRWVVDLRLSFRYLAAALIIIIGTYLAITSQSDKQFELAMQLISVPFSLIFGERMWLGLNGSKK